MKHNFQHSNIWKNLFFIKALIVCLSFDDKHRDNENRFFNLIIFFLLFKRVMEFSFVQLTFLVRETLKPVCITLKGHVYCRRIDVPHAWEDRNLAIRLQMHLPGPHPALQSPILTGHILGIMTCSLDTWNTDSSGSSICSLSQWEVVPKEDSWQPEVTNLEVLSRPELTQMTWGVGVVMGIFWCAPTPFVATFKSVTVPEAIKYTRTILMQMKKQMPSEQWQCLSDFPTVRI